DLLQLLAEAEGQQDLDPVGPQDDPGAGRAEVLLSLVVLDLEAGPPAHEMGGQPADPGTHHDDSHKDASFIGERCLPSQAPVTRSPTCFPRRRAAATKWATSAATSGSARLIALSGSATSRSVRTRREASRHRPPSLTRRSSYAACPRIL